MEIYNGKPLLIAIKIGRKYFILLKKVRVYIEVVDKVKSNHFNNKKAKLLTYKMLMFY